MTAAASTAELLVRGAAIGIFVLLSLRIAAGGRTPARLTGALFALAAAAHTLTQLPAAAQALGPVAIGAWVLSVMAAGLFWVFALELFGDHARLEPARLLPALVLLGVAVAAKSLPFATARPLWLAHNLIGAGLMLHVLVVVWSGWRGDLVEARRRLRGPLLALAAIYTLVLAAVQTAELYIGPATALSFLAAANLLALSLASGVVFLRDDPRLFGAAASAPARKVAPRDEPLLQRLGDYVRDGVMDAGQARAIRAAVAERRNVVVSGAAGSGKTTLANAILAEPALIGDRVFLIEDTPELQCSAWDLVPVLTRRHPKAIGVVDLVRDALRMRPDRIVVGELREGAAVLETLKAWNTGHPGGVTTVHANSAEEVLFRLEDLLAEVAATPPRRALGQAIDLIVHVVRTAGGRRVEGVLSLDGLDAAGAYRLSAIT